MNRSQCRAGRALVEMSQADLAKRAEVGLSTVKNFEAGRSTPNAKNMADMVRALIAAGVVFIEENGDGPGVRLAKEKPKGKRR